jgi:hypothetical protein
MILQCTINVITPASAKGLPPLPHRRVPPGPCPASLAILKASNNELLVPMGVIINSALDNLFVFFAQGPRCAQRGAQASQSFR